MITFLIKVLIFDFLYSFVVGLVLLVVMLPFVRLSQSEQPGLLSYFLCIPVGMALCAIQGIMIAAAVVVALQLDPSRWDPLWYILGFCFSVPIAMTRSLRDPEQSRFAGLGILTSNMAYVAACVLPQHIPPLLGNAAVSLLLASTVAVAPSYSEASSRVQVRERLAKTVEEMNHEIANSPFSIADCPVGDAGKFCLELFRLDLRADLGLDRHYRVHSSRVDLDADESARRDLALLVGPGESSYGFFEERKQICQGVTLRLMREHALRIGIIYHTMEGIEITRGVIDLAACLDWEALGVARE